MQSCKRLASKWRQFFRLSPQANKLTVWTKTTYHGKASHHTA
jgi:hypothetical protein